MRKTTSKVPETHCWNCNAIQTFTPRRRAVSGGSLVQEVYIRCTTCRREKRLYLTTLSIEGKRKRIAHFHPNALPHTRAARICEELTDQIRQEALDLGINPGPLVAYLQ